MSADSEQLFQIYVLLQDLMKEHVNIHQCLQDISFGDPHRETIAAHAESIVQTCEELKRIVSPSTSICCK